MPPAALLQNLHGCEAVIWDQHLCKPESSCDCDYEAAAIRPGSRKDRRKPSRP